MPNAAQPRQISIQDLPALSRSALALLTSTRISPDAAIELLRHSVSASCLQCGIHLSGQEIVVLAQSEVPSPDNPKLKRVLKGYCARTDCPSYYYHLQVTPIDGIDWNCLTTEPPLPPTEAEDETAHAEAQQVTSARRSYSIRLGARIAAFAGLFLLLLLVRQWYIGGTIPLLREPEHFSIDPTSLEQNF